MSNYYSNSIGCILFIIYLLLLSACSKETDPESGSVKINLNKSELILEIGSESRLVAGFEPSDIENTAHQWISENPSIATVDETGLVKGVTVGKTKITAKSLNYNCTATCEVNVVEKIIPVTSIVLSTTEDFILIGDSKEITASVAPENATDKTLSWSSSNTSIATVSPTGVVTALAEGKTVITATSSNGKTAKCDITVGDRNVLFSVPTATALDDNSINVTCKLTSQEVEIEEIGICYSDEKTPHYTDNAHKVGKDLSVNSTITGLKAETEYFIRVYAKSKENVYYSSTVNVTTTQKIVTDFKLCSIYCDHYKDDDKDSDPKNTKIVISTPYIKGIDKLNICYGLAPNPEITDNITYSSSNDGKYYLNLYKLEENKTYYVRAYTMKDNKPYYHGESAKFSTFGNDVKISEKLLNDWSQSPWEYSISYILPSSNDEYQVTLEKVMGSSTIGKSRDEMGSNSFYVKGGSGTIYASIYYNNVSSSGRDYHYGSARITFFNLRTSISYTLMIGRKKLRK